MGSGLRGRARPIRKAFVPAMRLALPPRPPQQFSVRPLRMLPRGRREARRGHLPCPAPPPREVEGPEEARAQPLPGVWAVLLRPGPPPSSPAPPRLRPPPTPPRRPPAPPAVRAPR
uniref:Uncharacterized protein n=1 Tax=Sphaerodactylus townsendi TaxID=933632 RepID=A0ACB8E7D1_9SAUR